MTIHSISLRSHPKFHPSTSLASLPTSAPPPATYSLATLTLTPPFLLQPLPSPSLPLSLSSLPFHFSYILRPRLATLPLLISLTSPFPLPQPRAFLSFFSSFTSSGTLRPKPVPTLSSSPSPLSFILRTPLRPPGFFASLPRLSRAHMKQRR